ncbi:Bax inhibitor 1-related [Dillenia turbinata]|uniref:Bax inhibitor 1-related n=1 Tax=Dillenia turbinata TaxID=194707 RepID=A0AAN8UBT1_9MAGN
MGKHDIETGNGGQLYPNMMESPELRWAFIRKVYTILSMQFVLTAVVAGLIVFIRPFAWFMVSTPLGFGLYITIVVLSVISVLVLACFKNKHPLNFFLLMIFTVCIAFTVGMACAFTKGEIILEAAILTGTVFVSLTLYTFWAAKRGHDFNFLGPFLFAALLVLMVFGFIQFFFPLGKVSMMIYGGLAALIFSAYIIYDTDNLIKRHSYDDYIWAAVSLYLDIINLFMAVLSLLRVLE